MSGQIRRRSACHAGTLSVAAMKMKIMKRDELLTLARHMKIRNKSTANANELRDALREKGAIDDKDQITSPSG